MPKATGVICPGCQHPGMKVLSSRGRGRRNGPSAESHAMVERHRACENCGRAMITYEISAEQFAAWKEPGIQRAWCRHSLREFVKQAEAWLNLEA